jgi:hypothetical protein
MTPRGSVASILEELAASVLGEKSKKGGYELELPVCHEQLVAHESDILLKGQTGQYA